MPCNSDMGVTKIYKPYQHKARPQGYNHDTVFASIELWMDDLPDALDIGGFLWVKEKPKEDRDEQLRKLI